MSKGQIVLPVKIRAQDSIRPIDELEVHKLRRGAYKVDSLLTCPEHGWFVPIVSESTDELGSFAP